MHMTIQPATKTIRGGYLARGETRLFCAECIDRTDYLDRMWYDANALTDEDACDWCHKPHTEWVPVVVTGTAVVEHVECKVF